jgi:hypothetical protein
MLVLFKIINQRIHAEGDLQLIDDCAKFNEHPLRGTIVTWGDMWTQRRNMVEVFLFDANTNEWNSNSHVIIHQNPSPKIILRSL